MQPLYIELSDEITTVIGRMKEANDTSVALVVPKGAILLQSVINLKLARRAAAEAGKELSVIITDKIGRNLCKQIGIPSFTRLGADNMPEVDEEDGEDDSHVINGVKIHRYYDETAAEDEPTDKNASEAPIVPKGIMKEAEKKVEPEPEPMKIRPVAAPELVEKEVAIEEKIVPIEDVAAVAEIESTDIVTDEVSAESKEEITAVTEQVTPENPVTETVSTASKKAAPAKKTHKRHPAVLIAYLVILLVLVGGAAGAYFLPLTSVTITVKPVAWTQQATLAAKDGGDVPIIKLTGEAPVTTTFKASGTKDIGNKATGTATLYNTLGSAVSVAAGAVITANGQTFAVDTATTVPAITYAAAPDGTPVGTPGSATVNVTAQNAGPGSNMSGVSGTVTGSKAYARIISAAGGSTQVINVITSADISAAQATLTGQAKTDSLAKLTAQLQGKDYIFNDQNDTFALNGFASGVAAGTQADNATATAKGTISRLVIDRAGVIAAAQTKARTAETAPSSTLFVDATDITGTSFDTIAGTASVVTSTHGRTSPSLDAAALKNSLPGKSLTKGVNLVKDAAKNNGYVVKQTPTWWPLRNFPLSKHFLSVTITYE